MNNNKNNSNNSNNNDNSTNNININNNNNYDNNNKKDFDFRFYSILAQIVQGYVQKTKNVLSRNFSHTVIQKLNP